MQENIKSKRRDGEFIEYIKNERGLITKYEYDSYRNVLNVEHPDNTTESWTYLPTFSYVSSYTDAHGTKETYRYNATGQMIEKREAVGTDLERLTTLRYDAYGQLQERNERANLTAVNPDLDSVTSYQYDNFGNLTEMTDAENNRTQYQDYDAMGNAWTVIDARNKRRTLRYSKQGWLLESTSALGFVSTQSYNKVGERLSSTTPIDATRTETTTYEYDKAGRLVKTIDPQDGETIQRYDDEGRLVESEDARGVITAMAYDNRGRMNTLTDGNKNITETIYGDKSNALEGLVAERKYPTYSERYNYDKRDRVTFQTQVLSPSLSYQSETRYDAIGNVTAQIDAKGRTSLKEYDVLNRLIQETDPLLGRTKYQYDRRNNLTQVTDANENTHTFTYDRLNRKLTEKRPMGETIRYEYDENSNLTQRLSPNGAKRIYTFDDDNRLTKEEHFLPKTTTASKTMTYGYDRRGLLTEYDDGLTSGVYVHNLKGEKESETITFGKGFRHAALNGGRPLSPQEGVDKVYAWEYDCFQSKPN